MILMPDTPALHSIQLSTRHIGDALQSLRCSTTGKRLAGVDSGAIFLYCRECKMSHRVTKDELLAMFDEMALVVVVRIEQAE